MVKKMIKKKQPLKKRITKTTKKSKIAITTSVSQDNIEKINQFKENMKKIIDPHTGINIVDMEMVKNIVVKSGKVSLEFIPTSPFCPVVNYFVEEIKKAAKHAGFSDCTVDLKI